MAKTITTAEYATLSQNMTKPLILEFGADW